MHGAFCQGLPPRTVLRTQLYGSRGLHLRRASFFPSFHRHRFRKPTPSLYLIRLVNHFLERAYGKALHALSSSARRLYIRMSQRQPGWLRATKLSYPEIPNLDAAIAELVSINDTQLALSEADLTSLSSVLDLLLLPELLSLRKAMRMPDSIGGHQNRAGVLASLIKYAKTQTTLPSSFFVKTSARDTGVLHPAVGVVVPGSGVAVPGSGVGLPVGRGDGVPSANRVPGSTEHVMFRRAQTQLGQCLMLCPAPLRLWQQLQIVFFLPTSLDERYT